MTEEEGEYAMQWITWWDPNQLVQSHESHEEMCDDVLTILEQGFPNK
jgi:hypothetical protein